MTIAHSESAHIECSDCHKGKVHKNALVNKHTERVACQSCHIPTFAKVLPTKVWWDWSTAGKDVKPGDIPRDKNGQPLYDKMKGDFKWEKDVVPTYLWFDGNIERYIAGDKIDPSKVVNLTATTGSRTNPKAKIYPFKIMRGKQAYDSGNNAIAYTQVFGPPGSDAYWQKYDWNLAIAAGMKAAGSLTAGRTGLLKRIWSGPFITWSWPKTRRSSAMIVMPPRDVWIGKLWVIRAIREIRKISSMMFEHS